ncbi:MAG: LPS-assembly protein [Methylobacteriaceae bacterium]|jgi:LPS-assembly protein|nr:LPS-assembly protein [Methylobacteriaceae bacterium]
MGRRADPAEPFRAACTRVGRALSRARPCLLFAALLVASLASLTANTSVTAQTVSDRITSRSAQAPGEQSRMLVEAHELVYNEKNNSVEARGDVQINYKGRLLEADRVIYNRTTGRVYAEGHARLTESDGTVLYADRFDLTEDFRNGFVETLRVSGSNRTYFSSPRAERSEGETTTFENGTYTACEPCKDNPDRPPLWQVRAKRIIHKNDEQMVYYEDATLAFLGIPIAYVPFFSAPDPTVKRKSGLLAPHFLYKPQLGLGVGVPIFWDLAPNYDLTVTPTVLTKQGFLGEVEWRHRLENGSYFVRGTGIAQLDRSQFLSPPYGAGNHVIRGVVESSGQFNLTDKWRFGWDGAIISDKFFYSDYRQPNTFLTNSYFFREQSSTVYLTGKNDHSYFDLRGFYFQGLTANDYQPQQPVVAPMLEYNRRFDVAPERSFGIGGEVQLNVNAMNQYARAASFASTGGRQLDSLYGLYDVCGVYNRSDCLLRGIGGDYARGTVEASWKRKYIDPIGEVWTPFTFVRASGSYVNYDTGRVYSIYNQFLQPLPNTAQSNFIGSDNVARAQVFPGGGLEWRYPFFANTAIGTMVVEPIAQVVVRPDGPLGNQNSLINIDSQSLVFDDTNLFDWSRYSGYDRFETGTRVNYGGQYTLNFRNGGFLNVMAGQSYQLAGKNSYAMPDAANIGLSSGLDTRLSDFIGRISYSPSSMFSFTAKGRFDPFTFKPRRIDLVASANLSNDLTASIQYASYEAQPLIGYEVRRQGLSLNSKYNVTKNYFVNGNVIFDLSRHYYNGIAGTAPLFSVAGVGIGGGYQDDCTMFTINYTSVYEGGTIGRNQTITFGLQLRTLGDARISSTLANVPVSDGIKSQ